MAKLSERLGPPAPANQSLDARLTGGLPQNMAALEQVQQGSAPSGLDMLLKPENLIKLGLAAAGGLSGNKDLQTAGLGLGLGTLGVAGGQANEAEAQRQQKIDQLIGLVDKQQQRLVSLMQSQPGMFVDEEGKPVAGADPESLGFLSGLGVNVSPAAIVNRQRLDENNQRQFAVHSGLMENSIASGNMDNAANHLQQMFMLSDVDMDFSAARDMLDRPMEEIPGYMSQVADEESLINLLIWSKRENKPWWDPAAPRLLPKMTSGQFDDEVDSDARIGMNLIVQRLVEMRDSTDPELQRQYAFYTTNGHKALELLEGDETRYAAAVQQRYAKRFDPANREQEFKWELLVNMTADAEEIEALKMFGMQPGTPEWTAAYNRLIESKMYNFERAARGAAAAGQIRQLQRQSTEKLESQISTAPTEPTAQPASAATGPEKAAAATAPEPAKPLQATIKYVDQYPEIVEGTRLQEVYETAKAGRPIDRLDEMALMGAHREHFEARKAKGMSSTEQKEALHRLEKQRPDMEVILEAFETRKARGETPDPNTTPWVKALRWKAQIDSITQRVK